MARKNPVPNREKEICRRIRLIRQASGLTQTAAARELEIDRALLASYELGRVPVRYHFADRFCAHFWVSQRWLAEEKEPKQWYVFVDKSLREKINPNAHFSHVYDSVLRPLLDKALAAVSEFTGGQFDAKSLNEYGEAVGASQIGELSPEAATPIIARQIYSFLNSLPPHLYQPFYNSFLKLLDSFKNDHSKALRNFKNVVTEAVAVENELTYIPDNGNTPSVKAQWPLLKKRLQKATEATGRKTRLAEFLGVKLSNVSQWLTDHESAREPGAETALQMLNWVEQQERK